MIFLFRVDASNIIGSGHVSRCITLANEIKLRGDVCVFVCRNHSYNLGDLILKNGHQLYLLPMGNYLFPELELNSYVNYSSWLAVNWKTDAEETCRIVKLIKPDWLVVDHYAIDAMWEGVLEKNVKNIMVIDDLANRTHRCKLLLDQNLGHTTHDYSDLVPSYSCLLVGPRYALLRPEFQSNRSCSSNRPFKRPFKRILVSLGGVDVDNVTGQVLKRLNSIKLSFPIKVDVMLPSGAPHVDKVRKQAEQLSFEVAVNVGLSNVAELMCKADIAIGAAGASAWERCCLGLPTLLIPLAENQVSGAAALCNAGAAKMISNIYSNDAIFENELLSILDLCVLRDMSRAASEITDGEGVMRVVDTIALLSR